MKNIQIVYDGLPYRSVTAARWAVFFQALGLKVDQEPDGFDVGCGVRFVPDMRVLYPGRDEGERHHEKFYVIEDINLLFSVDSSVFRKIYEFSKFYDVTILDGSPRPTVFHQFGPGTHHDEYRHKGDFTFRSFRGLLRAIPHTADKDRFGFSLWHPKGRMWVDEHGNVFGMGYEEGDIITRAAMVAAKAVIGSKH